MYQIYEMNFTKIFQYKAIMNSEIKLKKKTKLELFIVTLKIEKILNIEI